VSRYQKEQLTSATDEKENTVDPGVGVHKVLPFEGKLHIIKTQQSKRLTVAKHAMKQALRCQSRYIIKASTETHVVSKQVLIAYVINRLIIVFVLYASCCQIILHTYM
jgi:hypothetical protein